LLLLLLFYPQNNGEQNNSMRQNNSSLLSDIVLITYLILQWFLGNWNFYKAELFHLAVPWSKGFK